MAYNTIKVKKYSDVIEELIANAAITPGHLIEIMTTGKVRVHATIEGNALPMFALEDELQGDGIDNAYDAAAPVQCWIPGRGDIVYGILKDNNDVDIGDALASGGDGTLMKHVADDSDDPSYPEAIIGYAAEAVDTSDSKSAVSRILVRIK